MNSFEIIKDTIKSKFPNADVREDSTIKSLGLDSLDLVDLIIVLEESLDIVFEDEELMGLVTVTDVINLVNKKK